MGRKLGGRAGAGHATNLAFPFATVRTYSPAMRSYARERAHDRITELAGQGLDVVTLWREAGELIEPLVPHYAGLCWFTLDPASLLITSHYNEQMPVIPPEMLAHEYYEDDVNALADVVRSPSGCSTIHEATGGDPSSSPRWQANMAMGGDQELIVGLRTPSGTPGVGSASIASRASRSSTATRSTS